MKIVFLLAIAIVVGCKAKHKETCDPDFDVFFNKFTHDSIFQKRRVHFPLKEFYNDIDSEELVEQQVNADQYFFTALPDNADGLYDIKIEKKKNSVTYMQTSRESYASTIWKFARVHECWMLIEITNITE
ncbi:MAG TPA: DUF4348 domain-containing protein [Flavobacterium sp.]|jgi:hypothetical protein